MINAISILFDPRRSAHLIVLAGVAVLGAAYVFELVLGYEPCALCLYQRLPWWIAIGIGSLAIIFRARPIFLVLSILAALVVLVNVPLAGYHVGVEQGWWAGPSGCSGGTSLSSDLSQALQSLSDPVPRCDAPAWTLFGLSMAGYNLLLALGVGGLALVRLLGRRDT